MPHGAVATIVVAGVSFRPVPYLGGGAPHWYSVARTPPLSAAPSADVSDESIRYGGPEPVAPIDVSLVVSTIGRVTELDRLLTSIATEQANGPTVELIVVDQSPDRAVLPLLQSNRHQIRWVYTETGPGVSLGRNAGLALATGRYVMFPDDDAWLPGPTLSGAVTHLDHHPDHIGLCVQLKDSRGRPSMLRWAPTARRVTKHNHHRTSIGSTMLFRTEAAKAAGGFDVTMGPGAGGWLGSCEDADFLLRIIRDGAVWYKPDLAIHHRDSRRDGGPEAERKALAYGCGQGHMWRAHGFAPWLIALILLRRFAGGLFWVLRGRPDIGRAHRAWGRGALNGLLGRPPLDLTAPGDNRPGAAQSLGGGPPPAELGRVLGFSVLATVMAMAATVVVSAIAARTWGPSGVVAVCSLVTMAMLGAAVARGWWIGRAARWLPAGGEEERTSWPNVAVITSTAALIVNGDVWLGVWLLDGDAAARYGMAAVVSAQIATPTMLAATALAPRIARSIGGRALADAEKLIQAVARVALVVAVVLAGLGAVAGADLLQATHGPGYAAAHSSLLVLLAGDLVAATLGSALVVLVLAGRRRMAGKVTIGSLAVAGPVAAVAARLGGETGLAVVAAATTAGLYLLLSTVSWITTGISSRPHLWRWARASFVPAQRRLRSAGSPQLPAGQGPIDAGSASSLSDPDLSLIVSTIGRPEEFRRMVNSIASESGGGLDFELVVVDQSCRNETRRILEEAALPFPWRHVRSARGVSLARNMGLSLARGRYITFPDDDVWYSGAMLAQAVDRLNRAPNLAGLCARLAAGDGSDSMLRWSRTPKPVTHRNHHRTSIGPVMVMRREVACRIGGFDEALGPGTVPYGAGEDADLVLRIIESGETIWYDPDLYLHHRDPRLDGDPDAQAEALAYGCGQGRMWRLHHFGRGWISFLLVRRLIGSILMAFRGHTGVGRAQRAWVRGALAELVGQQPIELRPVEPDPAIRPAAGADPPPAGPGADGILRRPTANEFARGFKFRLAMSVIGMTATFALTAIATRLLADGELTRFYTLLASLAILPVLSRFGLNTKAIQELGAARGRGDWAAALRLADHFVRACLVPSLLTGPLAAVVFIAWSSGELFTTYAILGALILVTESVRLTYSEVLLGLGYPGWGAALGHQVRAVAVVAIVAVDRLVFDTSMNLVRLLTIMAAIGVLLAAVGQIRLWLIPGRAGGRPMTLDLAALARAGAPFAIAELGFIVMASGDIWLASKAFDPTSAAIYSTASVLAKQIVAPVGLANLALGPVAAGYLAQRRTADLERIVRAVLSGLGLLLLPGLLVVAVFGDRLLSLAYGERFEAAHVPFAVLLVGYAAVLLLGLSQTVLLMAGGQRLSMAISLGWTMAIIPFGIAAAVLGGPTSLAVAAAFGTTGLVGIQAVGAWIITGIRVFPSPQALRDLLRRWDRLSSIVPGG